MISIDLGTLEYYKSETNEFINEIGGIVRFEYSLKAVYEWEGKWGIPFLKGEITDEQLLDMFELMALDPFDFKFLTKEVSRQLTKYMGSSPTATTFNVYEDSQNGSNMPSGKTHTAEEIYALMFTAQIPLEFENRNLNRLLTMLKIISAQNSPPKKMSNHEILKQNSNLNAQRKAQLNSKG